MNQKVVVLLTVLIVLSIAISSISLAITHLNLSSLNERLAGFQGKIGSMEQSVSQALNLTTSLNERLNSLQNTIELLKQPFPVSITDSMGRTVIISEPPKRIVSMAPSITEILFALGLDDAVVGVTSYCNYPPEVPKLVEEGKIEVIGGFTSPNIEKIVSLSPDLIIAVKLQERFAIRLESLGLKVMVLKSESVSDVFNSILLIGRATGTYNRAIELVNDISRHNMEIWNATSKVSKKSVLVIVWLNPIYVAGGNTYINDLIELAGGTNVFNDKEGWITVSIEEVIKRNPDVIIVTGHAAPEKSASDIMSYLSEIPGWKDIEAIKNKRVYIYLEEAEDVLVRPGPRIDKAVQLIAMTLYPRLFNATLPNVIEGLSLVYPILTR